MLRPALFVLVTVPACSTAPAHWFAEGDYDAELTLIGTSCPAPVAVFDPWWDAWICRLGSFDDHDEVRGSATEAPACPDLLSIAPHRMTVTLVDEWELEFELADEQLRFSATTYVDTHDRDAWFEDVAPRRVPGGGDRVPVTIQLEETRSGYAGELSLEPVDVLTNDLCAATYDLRLRR